MKKGYYQITEALESAASANDQINQVTWGDIFDLDFRKQDIYHRTLGAISEILATFRRGGQYDAYFRLINDPVADPFDEDMEANICGWKATLQIEAINPNNIC